MGGNDSNKFCLNDYVIIRYLSVEAYTKSVAGFMASLASTVTVPLLVDLLTRRYFPCLLFYDEVCPRSQTAIHSLEDDIQKAVKACINNNHCLTSVKCSVDNAMLVYKSFILCC